MSAQERQQARRGEHLIPVAEVRAHNGVPTLFIDGQPHAGMTFTVVDPLRTTAYIADFGGAGVKLVSFCAEISWPRQGRYDFEGFDARMRAILAANHQALILPRVYVDPPPWWCEAHPDALARREDGSAWSDGHHGTVPSWASPVWREAACDALARCIRHVRQSDYAGHVFGYHVASGHTGEWFWWGRSKQELLDYSDANRLAFIRFLRQRYGTQAALRRAWRDDRLSFGAVTLPGENERLRGDIGEFRDEDRSRRAIDFYDFHNDLVVETIETLAAVAKKETRRQQLCGFFYGYLASAESGHLALTRLLECSDVDFLTAPSAYWGRQIGRGQSRFDAPIESIRLHGKLWFDENDYRTCLTPPGSGWGRTENMRDCIEVQKRELALAVTEGSAMWWFDMGGGWFDDPRLMRTVAQLTRIAERSVAYDRSSVAEIAFCLDERSMSHVRPDSGNHALGTRLITRQKLELARLGAPYDCLLLDDLERARPYKLYIFPNAFHVSPPQQAMIDRVVKREGRTALWLYAPGFAGAGNWQSRALALTGFHLHCRPARQAIVRVQPCDDPMVANLRGRRRWSCGKLDPLCLCDDPAATTLGVLDGGGETGLAIKRFEDWTSIYSSAVTLPMGLLRAIAESSGVHIYNRRDDALYVNATFLGLHARTSGRRRLRFRRCTDVFDCFGERQLACGVTGVSIELTEGQTALYFMGSRAGFRT